MTFQKAERENIELLKKICVMKKAEVYKFLKAYLKKRYKKVIIKKDYIIAVGEVPICLVAHVDTVGEEYYNESCPACIYDQEQDIFHAFGGCTLDDRLGIWAMIAVIESGSRPSIIIATDEEVGDLGILKLCNDYKKLPMEVDFFISLDRANYNDSVFYQWKDAAFEKYINSFGFKTAHGIYTSIVPLMATYDVGGVNLSISYYNEHSFYEYGNLNGTISTIDKVNDIILDYSKRRTFDF